MSYKYTAAEKAVISTVCDAANLVIEQPWFRELPQELKDRLYEAHHTYFEVFKLVYGKKDDADE